MCYVPSLLLLTLFSFGNLFRYVNAEYWVIVKVRINGTTEWEDGSEFGPIPSIYTISVSNGANNTDLYNNLNENYYYYYDDGVLRDRRDLTSVLFDDDHVNWFNGNKNATISAASRTQLRKNHLDETAIGHIIFIALVDIIVVIGIILVGMNYVKLVDFREQNREPQEVN